VKIPAGRPKGTTGTVFTTEHKQKLSDAHRGKVFSSEHRQKIGESVRAAAIRRREQLEEAGIIPENS
jgi:NUMOD3 motif-containing protein